MSIEPPVFSSARLQHRFATLQAEDRGGLVVYIMAADPDVETSLAILKGLPKMGVDVIELGLPFSDPMADGPIIQAASQRALKAGGSLVCALEMVRLFRADDSITPLVLMSYYNPIYAYGPQRFARAAAAVGVDGCLVVDLPPEEADELAVFLNAQSVACICLIAPTTDYSRINKILEKASGFLYHISIKGVTGTTFNNNITQTVLQLRDQTELPIVVGFGINTPEQVATIARVADAAVVGSAVVRCISGGLDSEGRPLPGLVDEVLSFVDTLATAAHAS